MSSFHTRPRFEQTLDQPPETIQFLIGEMLVLEEDKFELDCFHCFSCLRISEKNRHFWSPRLNLSFEETGNKETIVRGIYGPNANVWSLFLFSYIVMGFLAVITGVISISQYLIDSKPWGIYPFSVAMLCLATLYIVAQYGQKLGAQQTFLLHQTYESAVGESVVIH